MKKMNDNDILEFIGDSFREEAEKTELPEALSKENIVAMLKAGQSEEKTEVTVTKPAKAPAKHIYIGKYVTVAAALVFVIGIAAFVSASRLTKTPSSVKTGTENHDSSVTGTTAMASVPATDPKKLEDNIIRDLNSIVVTPADSTDSSGQPVPGHRDGEPVTRVSGLEEPGVQGVKTSVSDKKIVAFVNENGFSYRFASSGTAGKTVEIVSLSDMSLAGTINLADYNLLAAGDLFEDILVSGNSLVLIFDRGSSAAVTAIFDVSEPSSPVLKDAAVSSGSYIDSCVSGNSLAVFTAVNSTDASVSVNSEEIEIPNEAYLYDESIGGTVYTLVTVINTSDEADISVVLSGGKADRAILSGSDIYVAVPCSPSSAGLSTEIKKLTRGENGWQAANYTTVSGKLCSQMNILNGKLRFVCANGNSCTAYVLNSSLGDSGSAEFTCGISSVSFMGNFAVVSGSSAKLINFSSSAPAVSTPADSEGFVNSSAVYVLDSMVIGASKPDGAGKIHWSIIGSTGNCTGFAVDAALLTPNTTANGVCNENGSVAGVPVSIKDCPGYLFFKVDSSGNISGEKSYAYDGSASDSSVIIGDTLYIINENRIMSVSVSEIFG